MEIRVLQETADLARISMSKEELLNSFPAFEEMLSYFAAMEAADKDKTAFPPDESRSESSAAFFRRVNAAYFRGDSVTAFSSDSHEDPGKKMIEKAGERDGRFIVIPNVL